MTEIDDRLVQMKFDNKQFEAGVKESTETLNKFNKTLNMDGMEKGLEKVSAAAKNLSLSGIVDATENVKLKFSAMEIAAITTISNITNSAVNAGKRIVSAFTIDPVKTGFKEYETQINAIQTILANTSSKGTTLDQVNSALNELNHYADSTIYNFTEMTKNVGTFTAAGVDLNTSVQAIKGIANLAAVSGSTSQQAATAMYQLSQALASGTVKLMDWNSVVNAGMGGQIFQDALKETARVHGIAIDQMIKDEGSFRETLQEGWLTSNILTETLSKFTGDLNADQLKTMGYSDEQIKSILKLGVTANDAATEVKTFTQLFDTLKEAAQSGWTQSWTIIVGDFEEAKSLLTDLSNTFSNLIGQSATARNNILEGWKALGGRLALIQTAKNALDAILRFIKPIKEGFRDIFPEITSRQLFNITKALMDFTEALKISDETASKIKSTVKGFFAILDIGKELLFSIGKVVLPFMKNSGKLADIILNVSASFGDWLVELDNVIKKTKFFDNIINNITGAVKIAYDEFQKFREFINAEIGFPWFEVLLAYINNVKTRFLEIVASAQYMGDGIIWAIEYVSNAFEKSNFYQLIYKIWRKVRSLVIKIVQFAGDFAKGIADSLKKVNFSNLFDLINGAGLSVIIISIIRFFKNLGGSIGDFIKTLSGSAKSVDGMLDKIKGVLDGVRGCLEAYQTKLKASALMKIAIAIALLAHSILILSTIDSKQLTVALAAITGLFTELIGSLALISKIDLKKKGIRTLAKSMILISTSILILAIALKSLSGLSWSELAKGISGIAALSIIMVASSKILSSNSKTTIKGITQMVIFAAAIKILASAVKDLADLSWNDLVKGLTGVGILMAEIALFLNFAKFNNKSLVTATAIVILAAAMKILASAVSDLGQLRWRDLAKGVVGIGILLTEIVAFSKLSGDPKQLILSGIGMIAIAAAMKILASAMSDIAQLRWRDLAKGIVGIASSLLILVVALNLMPSNMIGMGIGLVVVSSALLILAQVFSSFGGMSWQSIAKSIVVLAGSLAILAIALNAMSGASLGAAALLIAAAALAILTPVLLALGNMSWQSIAKGLVTIAGVFAIFGVAGLLLGPVVPIILALSTAIGIFALSIIGIGAGLTIIGLGLSLIAIGFTALAAAATAGAAAIVTSLSVIVIGVASLIPAVAEQLGLGIVKFVEAIANSADALISALVVIVKSLMIVFTDSIPLIVDGLFKLIDAVLLTLVKYVPSIVDSLMKILINIIEAIALNLPDLIVAVVDVIVALFSGVVEALKNVDVKTLAEGIAGVGLIAALILALASIALLIPAAMIALVGIGLFVVELSLIMAALGAFSKIPGLKWIMGEGAALLGSIGKVIGSFIGGIIGGITSEMAEALPSIGSSLSSFMLTIQPFINGAKTIDSSSMDSIKSLAGAILALTGANIINGISSWLTGGSSLIDFGKELAEFGPYFKKYADSVAGLDPQTVSASATAAKTLGDFVANLPKQGGITDWFTGKMSLSSFADELVLFGPKLKAYADSISGIDSTLIEESSTAAKSLGELANNLPNSGGMTTWFVGDNTLSKFADELVLFGPKLKAYADSVTGLDPSVVTNSANAAKALAELSEGLPNSGGVASWFAGDNDLGTFSSGIEQFGDAMGSYYKNIKDIDPDTLQSITSEFKQLVDVLVTFSGIEITGSNTLYKAFYSIVGAGISGLVDKVAASSATVSNSATCLINYFIDGLDSNEARVSKAMESLISNVLKEINVRYYDFYKSAQNIFIGFSNGLTSRTEAIKSNVSNILNNMLNVINSSYVSFYNAGSYLVDGFANGIDANRYAAEAKAAAMAQAAVDAARKTLDERSPSKIGYQIGDYFGAPFVDAMAKYIPAAFSTGKKLASSAKEGLQKTIQRLSVFAFDEIDNISPVISPVLDLSSVRSSLKTLDFGSSAIGVNAIEKSFASERSQKAIQNGGSVVNNQFVQNISSPKAVDTVEIYRQTKNLYAKVKNG